MIIEDADFVNNDEAKTATIERLSCISEQEVAEAQQCEEEDAP
jgi:hypothetical protein